MSRRIVLAAVVVGALLASAAGCPPRHDVPASCDNQVQATGAAAGAGTPAATRSVPAGQPSPYPHAWEVCR